MFKHTITQSVFVVMCYNIIKNNFGISLVIYDISK